MIDRDLQAVIDAMAAAGLVPPRPLDAATMRAVFDNPMPGEPLPVAEVRDLKVPGGAGTIPARLYHPQPGKTLPVTVLMHGGGWVVGTLDTADAMARRIARGSGGAVLSLDYRLAPEHPYPAPFDDCLAAVCALPDLAEECAIDPSRFALCGDSAGGNLAAAVALALRGADRSPLRQILLYPVVDTDFTRKSYSTSAPTPVLDREMMEFFWDAYLAGAEPDAFSAPLRADSLAGVAPALVLLAGQDPLHDEGLAYAQALREAGVPVDLHVLAAATHGVASFAGAAPVGDLAMHLVTHRLQTDFAHAG